MKNEELYKKVLEYLEKAIPVAETELHYENPFQLLIAVILSAQCTDKRVNMVTPDLFAAYAAAIWWAGVTVKATSLPTS